MANLRAIVLMVILAVLGGVVCAAAAGISQKEVLILNAYHQGEDWSDNQINGILEAFKQVDPYLIPCIEHLDTKRFPGEDYLAFVKNTLKTKYRARRFDLLIVLDNSALELMLTFRDDLFPDVPIVFAGINGYHSDMLKGRTRITGVTEDQDMAGTLDLILKIHPETKSILAIHDYTSSGHAVHRDMERAYRKFEGRVTLTYTPEGSADDLAKQLKGLSRDTVVMLLTYVTDKNGRTLTREESTRLVTESSPVPVYAMHETRLGYGIVGGMLLEGSQHGQQAARLGIRILKGEAISKIPVERSNSRMILDYHALTRFQIPQRRWPEDAIIINRPVSFWQENRGILIPALIIVITLLLITVISIVLTLKMRLTKEALQESEEKYRVLFHSIPAGITVSDRQGNILEDNEVSERLLGLPRSDHEQRTIDGENWKIIRTDGTLMPPEEFASVKALKENRIIENAEMGIVKADGRVTWINVTAAPIPLENYGVLVAYVDFTSRKEAEDKLKHSLVEKETLLEEIHHRVKNNMQVIASLLALQANGSDDERIKGVLKESQGRVFAMSAVHEALYDFENLSQIDIRFYLTKIANAVSQTYVSSQNIRISIETEHMTLTIERASPVGLIVNELLSNSFRHAFPDQGDGSIDIHLKKLNEDWVELTVRDNGVGLPPDFDWKTARTVGLRLVRLLAEDQLDGSITRMSGEDGTTFAIRFPMSDNPE